MDYQKFLIDLDSLNASLVRFVTRSQLLMSRDVALLTGIQKSRVSQLRLGSANPTPEEVKVLAAFFSVTPSVMRAAFALIREWRQIREGATLRPSRSPNREGT